MTQEPSWDFPQRPLPSYPPGWYPDPWQQAPWRWWTGHTWSEILSGGTPVAVGGSALGAAPPPTKKPFLPAWLSVPVVIAAIPVVLAIGYLAFVAPLAIVLGLIPFLIVLPVLSWLDRVEPEPRAARIHAILWGATVAVVVSFIVNTVVALSAGELVAGVLSAPIVEEAMKGLGILYAVRRKEVDGLMDGIVYAGWVAVGFAVVEDFLYLSTADETGEIWQVFFIRVILTPFAHPLFTFWLGLAIGLAVSRNRKVFPYALWGYALAVATHMLWNGSLSLADATGGAVLLLAIVIFVALFVSVAITLAIIRTRFSRAFIASIPWLAHRYGVSETEVAVFSDWRGMLRFRRRLSRADRKRFDAIHVALARLMLLHQRPGAVNPVQERILADQLQEARYGT